MWENWEKTKVTDTEKMYSRLINVEEDGLRITIELTAMIEQRKDDTRHWNVLVTAFHPSAGEYIDFESSYQFLDEAENAAWSQAQRSVGIRLSRHPSVSPKTK